MKCLRAAILSLLTLTTSQLCRAESETHKTLTDVKKTVNESNSRYSEALEDANDEAAKSDSSESEPVDGDEQQAKSDEDGGAEE